MCARGQRAPRGGLRAGRASEAAEQRPALCSGRAAGRRGPGPSRPGPCRGPRIPAAAGSWQPRGGSPAAALAGPLALPALSRREAREEREVPRPPRDANLPPCKSTDLKDLSTSGLFTGAAQRQTLGPLAGSPHRRGRMCFHCGGVGDAKGSSRLAPVPSLPMALRSEGVCTPETPDEPTTTGTSRLEPEGRLSGSHPKIPVPSHSYPGPLGSSPPDPQPFSCT